MPERVRLTDVSPRDGLQNEPIGLGAGPIPTDRKAELVRALDAVGVDEIEITSFVNPKWVPQLGDAAELCAQIAGTKPDKACYSALVPNERGLDGLLAANEAASNATRRRVIDKVSVFTAASETFSQRNTNASIAETLERFRPVAERAREAGLATRGYVSCAVACPFEGSTDPAQVADVAGRLLSLGIDEIDLGDTIGAGTPESIDALLNVVLDAVPVERVVLHLHDTFGRAAACVAAGLSSGVRRFDGAVGGLGGCPYASTATTRAPGNIGLGTLAGVIEAAGHTVDIDQAALKSAEALAAGMRAPSGGSE
ncbi:MAG: hydroxymethylglutaryl-CoA lyase, partial [Planctomycetota bacterium]